MPARNAYQILGVDADATLAEIKRAYKRLAMRWHPDRNPDPRANDVFVHLEGDTDVDDPSG